MKALVVDNDRALRLLDNVELAAPGPGQVQLEVRYCGICHSDLHAADGTMPIEPPFVPGHEVSGVIREVGDGVRGIKPGRRVAVAVRPACGTCYWCLAGEFSLCVTFGTSAVKATVTIPPATHRSQALNTLVGQLGGLAERINLPVEAVMPLPDDVPLTIAAVMTCGVTTGVGAALNTAQVRPGERILIVGTGTVGMSSAFGARLAGASLVVSLDLSEQRRKQAMNLGVDVALDPEVTSDEALQALVDGIGFDAVLDVVGLPATVSRAVAMTRRGGRTVLVGVPPRDTALELTMSSFRINESKLLGCAMGSGHPARELARLIAWWRGGKLPLDSMLTQVFPLPRAHEAFDTARRGIGLKNLVSLAGDNRVPWT